ncbi:MAG: CRP-like cAMP-binding protein, partial [Kiritimatiellia bacterium]
MRAPHLDPIAKASLFQGLERGLLLELAAEAWSLRLGPGDVLVQEGAPGGQLYVVSSGRLTAWVTSDNDERTAVGTLRERDVVGEMGWLTGGPCSATVICDEAAELICLRSSEALSSGLGLHAVLPIVRDRLLKSHLALAIKNLLGKADVGFIDALAQAAQWRCLDRGERLFTRGDPGDGWFVVLSGSVLAVNDTAEVPRVLREMGPGESVGELSLLTGRPRTATVVARRQSYLAHFSHAVFDSVVRHDSDNLLVLMRSIVDRMQPQQSDRVSPHNIVLLPRTPGAPVAQLASTLAKHLARTTDVVVVSEANGPALGLGDAPHALPLDDPSWLRLSL